MIQRFATLTPQQVRVLMMLREQAPAALRIGFALETDDAVSRACAKLEAKGLDLVVVNDAREPGAGLEVETNRVTILGSDGSTRELPLMPKREVAAKLWDLVAERRRARSAPARS